MTRLIRRAVAFAALLLVVNGGSAIAQKNCVKGKPCGNTCIAANKTCRIGSSTTTAKPPAPAAAVVPAGMQFVASTRGTTYYYVGCSGWKSLAVANLRYFRTVDDARAAGLKPSTQAGCAGPAVTATPAGATVTSAGGAVCIVATVTDGDTLNCADGRKVRLLLIDAPEMDRREVRVRKAALPESPRGKQCRDPKASTPRTRHSESSSV